jgi:S1-C subfamily serine protease
MEQLTSKQNTVLETIREIIDAEKERTNLSSIIYGYVLNSTGSIIPLIWDSIKNERTLVLYSEEMTRFLIEIEDAIWGKLPTLTLRQVVYPPITAAASASAKGEENLPKNLNQESESKAKSSGSGFLVSRSGIVATNYHVIEDAKQIIVMLPNDNRKYMARVIANDKRNDLALIQIDDFPANSYKDKIPYKIKSTQAVQISNKVFTIGYPLTSFLGTKPKFSDGTISSITGPRDDPRLLQMNASIQPGNSGGPLFSIAGEVVGIVVASANAKFFYDELGVIPQNVNFAVKSDYLLSLLFSEKIKIDQEFDSLAKVESIEEFSERVLKYCPIIFSY